MPDERAVLHLRRLLKMRQLAERIFATINAGLTAKGLLVRPGTVVDATILAAPRGTKNAEGKRDPEIRPTQTRSDWRFGMKAHIGVDATSGLVPTLRPTTAKVHGQPGLHRTDPRRGDGDCR